MLKAKILFVGPCEVRPGPGAASGAASGSGDAPGAVSCAGSPQEAGAQSRRAHPGVCCWPQRELGREA